MKYLIICMCLVVCSGFVTPAHAQTATPTVTPTVTTTPTATPTAPPALGAVTLHVSDDQARQEEGAAIAAGLGIGFIVVIVGVFLHSWVQR